MEKGKGKERKKDIKEEEKKGRTQKKEEGNRNTLRKVRETERYQ